MFNEIKQSMSFDASPGVSGIELKPGEKIKIISYSNEFDNEVNALQNVRLVMFLHLPFRKFNWDAIIIYSPDT